MKAHMGTRVCKVSKVRWSRDTRIPGGLQASDLDTKSWQMTKETVTNQVNGED